MLAILLDIAQYLCFHIQGAVGAHTPGAFSLTHPVLFPIFLQGKSIKGPAFEKNIDEGESRRA